MIRLVRGWTVKRAAKTLLHPAVIGFTTGEALFWLYGLAALISLSANFADFKITPAW